jgi:hypothetical protein
MMLVTVLAIALGVLLATLATWRYVARDKATASPSAKMALAAVVFSAIAAYAFYVLVSAGISGSIECSSTRCGSSNAYLATGPLRFWLLYGFYWVTGSICSFLGMSSVAVVAKQNGAP